MKTFLKLLTGLTLLVLSPAATGAQTATLAEDIATASDARLGTVMRPIHLIGEHLFFTADDETSGREPWGTDGSVTGTRMLADACSGNCSSDVAIVGQLGGRLLWFNGRLWSTDGTPAETSPLTSPDLQITMRDSLQPDTALFGGRLYFGGCLLGNDCGLWQTAGTPDSTQKVSASGAEPSGAYQLTSGAGRLWFLSGRNLDELWTLDANGPRRIAEVEGLHSTRLWTTWRNLFFFVQQTADSRTLWVSDGTPGGTRMVTSFDGGLTAWLTTGNRGLYFVASDGLHGEEIWQSDGTSQGTRRVTDFAAFEPIFYSTRIPRNTWAVEMEGRLFFGADDEVTGSRLWVTSGTPESTRPASEPALSSPLLPDGDRVFFYRTRLNDLSCELWTVNAQGTGVRVAQGFAEETCLQSDLGGFFLQKTAGQVWFTARDASGWGVWRTDGSRAGTVRLFSLPGRIEQLAISPSGRTLYVTAEQILWKWTETDGLRQVAGSTVRNQSSSPNDLIPHAGRLFFSACDGTSREMWSSQGTTASTFPLTDFGDENCFQSLQITPSGSSVFFVAPTDSHDDNQELWKVNADGTVPVQLSSAVGGEGRRLVSFQGGVWFLGPDEEIWKSDGTPAGTGPALSLAGETLFGLSFEEPLGSVDGAFLYFLARRHGEVTGLWRTDGTPAGTTRLASSPSAITFEMARAGSTLFFSLPDGLWKTDGTPAGTVRADPSLRISRFAVHGGALYGHGTGGPFNQHGLWRTDGTAEGTWLVAPLDFTLLNDLPSGYQVPAPVSLGGRLFFVADDEAHGVELWATDGTPTGAALVTDLSPGPKGSYPFELTAAGGSLWFTAYDLAHGGELWRTDGTAAGTRLVQDIAPEGLSSTPRSLTVAGDRLYFSADDGITGRELWSLPLSGPDGCQPNDTTLCLRGGRFRVEAHWRDFEGHQGVGHAVPLTGDTGTFWFFEPSNVEVLLKVLDGRGLNDHFWVFFGALSSVEYSLTVTDTETGFSRRYTNPSGQLASAGDTEGFGPQGAHSPNPDLFLAPPSPAALVSARTEPAAATGSCQPGPRRLCLNGGRFAVEASWKDFQGNTGQGTAVPFTADTGWFWFFDPANVEVMLKVLDGTALNGKFWVFYGALSNVEYELTVTDTHTGAVKQYRNPSGQFASVADTGAF